MNKRKKVLTRSTNDADASDQWSNTEPEAWHSYRGSNVRCIITLDAQHLKLLGILDFKFQLRKIHVVSCLRLTQFLGTSTSKATVN